MKTRIIFRRWKGARRSNAIALFPDLPGTINPHTCLSYERIGQHGAADLSFVMFDTRPAHGHDVQELREELTRIGYDLREVKRVPRDALARRKEALKL